MLEIAIDEPFRLKRIMGNVKKENYYIVTIKVWYNSFV